MTVTRKLTDLTLSTQGASKDSEQEIQVCRIVAMVLMDHSVSLDVTEIAKASGLSEHRVRDLLSSKRFEDCISPVLRRKAGAALGRAVEAMGDLIENAPKPSDRIQAFRALVQMYSSVAKSESEHMEKDDRQELLKLLDSVRPSESKIEALTHTNGTVQSDR